MKDGGNQSRKGGAVASEPDETFLVAFLNTLDVEDGTDAIADKTGLAAWAGEHGLEPGDLSEAQRTRDALRELAVGEHPKLPAVMLEPSYAGGTIRLKAATVAEAALAAAVILGVQGRLARVKLCPADDCREAFYDLSRNGSRTWCSMEICGNRQKARSFRSKHADAGVANS
ncbi:CGNR zinc finger domain-containing protein [Luethyella okanaganae]|uniref:CGNR zinc finger domain-containing protein n=1 Tax=Luethyella okanaganae TaxID=69372 RepID=A0ABW1VJ95_9MICO